MKVISVVGARPQLVKLAPIASAMASTDHVHVIVHTGQHYDPQMSDVFFTGLGIPDPDVHLGVGSGTHGVQTGAMLADLEPILASERPDWVLVYGDTNSTIAAALAAVKLHLPVAHLEAGLRSFNRRMPEEHNRVLTDHASDLLLAPTQAALGHLAREGLADRAVVVGDVMVDVCRQAHDSILVDGLGASELPSAAHSGEPFLVATLHRPDNTDDPERLDQILEALGSLRWPVVLLAHPRLVARAEEYGIVLQRGAVRVTRPLAYRELVATVLASGGVITDSGGLQKEAFLLGRPCTTIRPETEWVETLDSGWNVLVPDPHLMRHDEWDSLATRPAPVGDRGTPYGDGHAATRVVKSLMEHNPR